MGYRAFLGRGLGRDALLKANRELALAGLRFQFKRRSPAGSIITDTIISEAPMTAEEAEAEWHEFLRVELKGYVQPVDNSDADRAPENGATGPGKGSTVVTVTGARSTGASTPRGVANSSSSTSYLEEEEKTNAGARGPAQGAEQSADDVTPGSRDVALDSPNRRAVREALEASKRAKLSAVIDRGNQKEVAPLQLLTGGGSNLGSPSHLGNVAR